MEYSADESENDDADYDSEWEIGRREPTIGAANEGQDVPSVSVNSPRSSVENAIKISTKRRRGNQHGRDAELAKWGGGL